MSEKWKKFVDEIVEEVGGGPLSPDVEAAIAEATRLAEGGAPAPESSVAEALPPSARQPLLNQTTLIPLEKLKDSPYQMRKEMDGDELQELADNIAKNGLESPITVREKDGELQIVCGHRRAQAFRRLQFNAKSEEERQRYSTIPAFVVRGMSDGAMLTTGWSENVLRANLTPLDMATGLLRIQQAYGLKSAVDVSDLTGVLALKVRRLLRLANAPLVVQQGMSVGVQVPISAQALAEDDRPDNERPQEERRTLGFTDALEFTRMHAQLLAKAAVGDLSQQTADQLTVKGIHQALTANWSSRQVEEFIARALGERVAKAPRKKTRPRKPFNSSNGRFVVFLRRLTTLTPQEKKELRHGLEPIWDVVKDA